MSDGISAPNKSHGGVGWWFLSLSAGIRFEWSVSEGTDTIHVRTFRGLGEGVPCLVGSFDFGVLSGCGVVQVGGLTNRTRVDELDYTRKGWTPNVSAGGRVAVQLRHIPFFPRWLDPFVFADVLGGVRRTNIYVLTSSQFTWSAPPVTFAVGLGVIASSSR